MTAPRLVLALGTHDPAPLAAFWGALLGREQVVDEGGVLLPGDAGQLALRLEREPRAAEAPPRAHLHLTSETAEHQQRTVDTALRLGARHLDVGQRPEEGHVVLADPAGYAFCVIEPGNRFLAGTGFLGELACEGSRDVGVFWSRALDWPLVWDQDEETAVQSPEGGTKVAWGGPPVAPAQDPVRPRLDLLVSGADLAAEQSRLVDLGARVVGTRDERTVVLTDPDGVAFHLRAAGH